MKGNTLSRKDFKEMIDEVQSLSIAKTSKMKNHSNPVRNTSVRGETCSYESALLAVNQSCQLLTLKLDYFLTCHIWAERK